MLSSDSDLFVAIGSDGLTVTTLPRAFPDLDPEISPSSCRSGSIASHTRGDRKGRPTEHAGRANPWEHYRGGCRASHTFETGVFEMEVVEFHHTAWQHTQAATARIGLSCGVREELGRSSYSWAYGSSTGTIYYGGKLQQKDREAYRPGDTVAVAYTFSNSGPGRVRFFPNGKCVFDAAELDQVTMKGVFPIGRCKSGSCGTVQSPDAEMGSTFCFWPHVDIKNATVRVNFRRASSPCADLYPSDVGPFLQDVTCALYHNPCPAPPSFAESMVIMLIGVPGVGKSRLADELLSVLLGAALLSTNNILGSAKLDITTTCDFRTRITMRSVFSTTS